MQDIEPGPLSRERRRLRDLQRIRLLLGVLSFAAGTLLGWFLLGWVFFPAAPRISPSALVSPARLDYVQMVVDAWAFDKDKDLVLRRLQGFGPQELASTLSDLQTDRKLSGDDAGSARVAAFASGFGIQLKPGVAVLGVQATPTPVKRAAAAAAATPIPVHIAIQDGVPDWVRASIREWVQGQAAVLVPATGSSDVLVSTEAQPGGIVLTERVYVLVDRFATLRSDVPSAQLRALWQGQPLPDGASKLLVTNDAAASLTPALGAAGTNVKTVAAEDLADQLWNDPSALGILPFDQLVPRLAVLKIDGMNMLGRDLQLDQYPLLARVYVGGQNPAAQKVVVGLRSKLPLTNRDTDRITTLIMTGTTAIARSAAYKIEQKKDPGYPARIIGPTLAAADITHISNEIPFVDNCQPVLETMVFCSKPSYMETFKLSGVDIVGLTGNHVLDYGLPPFLKTLDAYRAAGMSYFGGGKDATDASRVLYLEDHGNRLAFIGANSFGPPSVWATTSQPGAQRYDANAIKREVAEARQHADFVSVELQAEETYDYSPSANNQIQFRAAMGNGADVVTGVQAHQPQGFEFGEDGRHFILYGLGNLYFDQMFELAVRQGVIARHTIYQGRLLQTELLMTMLENYVQPRWMTPAERNDLLVSLFKASGWQWVPAAQK